MNKKPVSCRCLETSSWMMRVTLINTTTSRPSSVRWCSYSGWSITSILISVQVQFYLNYFPLLYVPKRVLLWCRLRLCSCVNHQECDGGVLAGDNAFLFVGSGVWTRPHHRAPHPVSGSRGRLWDWLCLLLFCLFHLLQLFPGQDSSEIKFGFICPHKVFSHKVFLPTSLLRCWICSWLWSWITLSTWRETPPSWVPITWMSLFASGGSMIVWHGRM